MNPTPACSDVGRRRLGKQVYALTLQDLITFPVWEFRLVEESQEGQDESTVQPCPFVIPLDDADRMFIVRAAFTLADTSRMRGYFALPGRGDASLATMQPIIVTDGGQVRLWCGTVAPGSRRLALNYQLLGKTAEQVFPLVFESDTELLGGPVKGILPGFLVLEDFETRETRTIT